MTMSIVYIWTENISRSVSLSKLMYIQKGHLIIFNSWFEAVKNFILNKNDAFTKTSNK